MFLCVPSDVPLCSLRCSSVFCSFLESWKVLLKPRFFWLRLPEVWRPSPGGETGRPAEVLDLLVEGEFLWELL